MIFYRDKQSVQYAQNIQDVQLNFPHKPSITMKPHLFTANLPGPPEFKMVRPGGVSGGRLLLTLMI